MVRRRTRARRSSSRPRCAFLLFFCASPLVASAASSFENPRKTTRTDDGDALLDSYVLLCLTDGSIYSLEAWTGAYQSRIATPPLRQTNVAAAAAAAADDASTRAVGSKRQQHRETDIIPGYDGRLYWRPPPATSEGDDQRGQRAPPPPLQELPITLSSLLENPVQSCADDDEDGSRNNGKECGIWTAQAETSLIALTASGGLLWRTNGDVDHGGTASMGSDGSSSSSSTTATMTTEESPAGPEEGSLLPASPLLLQRKDYWVQHVSSTSGRQTWNVSVGTYQALDFEQQPSEHREDLPDVVVSDRTVTAVAADGSVLWRQHVPAGVSALFGIQAGRWRTLQITQVERHHPREWPPPHQLSATAHRTKPPLPRDPSVGNLLHEPLWEQIERQQQQQRPTGRLELPGASTAQPDLHFCSAVGECPNFYNRSPLRLPAPPTVQPEGLLLSWSLVSTILLLFAAAAAGSRHWYLAKKRRWMGSAKSVAGGAARLSSSGGGGHRPPFRRSLSLPGALGAAAALPGGGSSSSGGPRVLSSGSGGAAVANSSDSSGGMAVKGFPLVRYSRYVSEFQELEALGEGGFGTVFRCRNVLDGRDYAIKKVSILLKGDPESTSPLLLFEQQMQRVLREVKILAVLDHPNIVRYYTAWLETAKKEGGGGDAQKAYDVNTSKYSSSLLLTENSASQWDVSISESPRRVGHWHHQATGKNPLGCSTGLRDLLEVEEDSLFDLPKRRSLQRFGSADDLLVFEHSQEEELQTSTGGRRDSFGPDLMLNGSPKGGGGSGVDRQRPSTAGGKVVTRNDKTLENEQKPPQATMKEEDSPDQNTVPPAQNVVRHTLYIQMQLCSRRTVADFLTDVEARRGTAEIGVDLPKALRMFWQIAEAVNYVHSQGLIHRDLKPQNCFLDDSGTIRVGDFGLSREENCDEDISTRGGMERRPSGDSLAKYLNDDHTAGVGTRSYASPEQMSGSDYDSSTDVYSLGIMLFEILYPMKTGMERNICLSRLRDKFEFPSDWNKAVGKAFPTLQGLIVTMLSKDPAGRPTADDVSRHIRSVLGDDEFTILLMNDSEQKDLILLRVEAEHRDDALRHTMQLIREESAAANCPVDVVQYGLRGGTSADEKPTAIMEFALRYRGTAGDTAKWVTRLVERPEITKARQVSNSLSTDTRRRSKSFAH